MEASNEKKIVEFQKTSVKYTQQRSHKNNLRVNDMIKKLGRNEKCHCNSGAKYKRCCMNEDNKKESISVFSEFSTLKDLRENRGKRYKLMDVRIISIYGILNDYDDFKNMADFLKVNELYLKNLLLIKQTLSHDCLSDLFALLNPDEFMIRRSLKKYQHQNFWILLPTILVDQRIQTKICHILR